MIHCHASILHSSIDTLNDTLSDTLAGLELLVYSVYLYISCLSIISIFQATLIRPWVGFYEPFIPKLIHIHTSPHWRGCERHLNREANLSQTRRTMSEWRFHISFPPAIWRQLSQNGVVFNRNGVKIGHLNRRGFHWSFPTRPTRNESFQIDPFRSLPKETNLEQTSPRRIQLVFTLHRQVAWQQAMKTSCYQHLMTTIEFNTWLLRLDSAPKFDPISFFFLHFWRVLEIYNQQHEPVSG